MKILFIKQGSFSKINKSVYSILEKGFPDDQIEIIDSIDIIKHKIPYYHYLINIYFFITEYGIEIVKGQKKLKDILVWFFATSYVSLKIGASIRKLTRGKTYRFTFQTQSLFNGKIAGIPHFIYTDHTVNSNFFYPDIERKEYMRSKRFVRKSEYGIFRDASCIFTFGNFITNSLITQYSIPKEKVFTVYAGSNVKSENIINPEKYYNKNILFVGVEWERKGGPMLLKIFQRVLQRFPDASLSIAGCNPKVGNIPNCEVLGKIPMEKLSERYNLASVFFLPTLREPFGIVFVEAMNYRLPIVANDIGCIPEIVRNDFNGYLINNNIDEYTNVICHLLSNPLKCQEMGNNGYGIAQSKLNWSSVGKSIKEIINKNISINKHANF